MLLVCPDPMVVAVRPFDSTAVLTVAMAHLDSFLPSGTIDVRIQDRKTLMKCSFPGQQLSAKERALFIPEPADV